MVIKMGRNIPIVDSRGNVHGFYNTGDKTYYKNINANLHMFNRAPSLKGKLASSKYIINQLKGNGCKFFCWTIDKWESDLIKIIITFEDFLKLSEEINFKGKKNSDPQIAVHIKYWKNYPSSKPVIYSSLFIFYDQSTLYNFFILKSVLF